eukprot:6207828-Pleurochrysis_carterae.AAC.1
MRREAGTTIHTPLPRTRTIHTRRARGSGALALYRLRRATTAVAYARSQDARYEPSALLIKLQRSYSAPSAPASPVDFVGNSARMLRGNVCLLTCAGMSNLHTREYTQSR